LQQLGARPFNGLLQEGFGTLFQQSFSLSSEALEKVQHLAQ